MSIIGGLIVLEEVVRNILMAEPVDQVQPLLFILQRLLRQLCGYLRARDAAAQRLRLGFIKPFQPIEWLELTLLQPSRDPQHLLRLWQEKLERHSLQSSVEGLELQVRQLLPLQPQSADLLGTPQKSAVSFLQMLERLKNRLGDKLIWQPQCQGDHRPEHGGGLTLFPHAEKIGDQQRSLRPLWLLAQPRPLQQSSDGGPLLQGRLTLLTGPERIESGWWDGHGQRRDYYIAHSRKQQRLWVYRTLKQPREWFLHGFFG
jgi:protein ImuB